jgi:glycine betaine/proline transport system permease protein
MADTNYLLDFPALPRDTLRLLQKGIDEQFRAFSRTYGEAIENFFDPLLHFMVWFEQMLLGAPWWLVIVVIAGCSYLASRSIKLTIGVIIAFLLIGIFGMWEDTMRTVSIITICTMLAIIIGIPIGVMMARYDRAQSTITPVLDVMQTMPSFVYLIPVVMLLGIGRVPGVISVVIYAIPPVIRLTNLGIRLVDKDVLEAANAFGADFKQRLFGVQIPLAMPNIMAGVNQTIMMSLAMVVIASMIGVKGLGQPVLKAITNQYFSMGLFNGLAIVAIAIVFDRVSQAYGRRIQKHRQVGH